MSHDITQEAMLARLKQIVWTVIDEQDRETIDLDSITPATELIELPLDSLATVEMMYAIEETFNVSVSEEQAFELSTVGNVIQFIQNKRPSASVR